MGIKFFCLRIDVRIENITVFSESWSSFPFNVIFQNATSDFESVFIVFCDGGRFFLEPPLIWRLHLNKIKLEEQNWPINHVCGSVAKCEPQFLLITRNECHQKLTLCYNMYWMEFGCLFCCEIHTEHALLSTRKKHICTIMLFRFYNTLSNAMLPSET